MSKVKATREPKKPQVDSLPGVKTELPQKSYYVTCKGHKPAAGLAVDESEAVRQYKLIRPALIPKDQPVAVEVSNADVPGKSDNAA